MNIDEYISLNKIICPACKSSNLKGDGEMQEGKITCNDCGAEYSLINEIAIISWVRWQMFSIIEWDIAMLSLVRTNSIVILLKIDGPN